MGAFVEPPLGAVAIGAEELESCSWPFFLFETSIKSACRPPVISSAATINVIDSKKMPISLSAAHALAAVSSDHFLPKSPIGLFIVSARRFRTFLANLLVSPWLADATFCAETDSRPTTARRYHLGSCFFAAAFTQLRRRIACLAAVRAATFLRVTLTSSQIGLFHTCIIPQYACVRQGL